MNWPEGCNAKQKSESTRDQLGRESDWRGRFGFRFSKSFVAHPINGLCLLTAHLAGKERGVCRQSTWSASSRSRRDVARGVFGIERDEKQGKHKEVSDEASEHRRADQSPEVNGRQKLAADHRREAGGESDRGKDAC